MALRDLNAALRAIALPAPLQYVEICEHLCFPVYGPSGGVATSVVAYLKDDTKRVLSFEVDQDDPLASVSKAVAAFPQDARPANLNGGDLGLPAHLAQRPQMDIVKFTDIWMLALTVWREASGESMEAKTAVAWVIRNRYTRPGWWGKDLVDVVTKYAQFSSINPPVYINDPNLRRYPNANDPSWINSLKAASDVYSAAVPDPVSGATYYYDKSEDKSPPVWAAKYTHVADIGRFHFYKS